MSGGLVSGPGFAPSVGRSMSGTGTEVSLGVEPVSFLASSPASRVVLLAVPASGVLFSGVSEAPPPKIHPVRKSASGKVLRGFTGLPGIEMNTSYVRLRPKRSHGEASTTLEGPEPTGPVGEGKTT